MESEGGGAKAETEAVASAAVATVATRRTAIFSLEQYSVGGLLGLWAGACQSGWCEGLI